MVQKTNVALVGLGYWGKKLLSEYAYLHDNNRLNLVAVVDPDEQARKWVKQNYPHIETVNDVNTLLKKYSINGVHIAVPNNLHYELSKYFLENRINVLVEKPMTLSTRKAFKLIRIAEENNVHLLVGHIFRFNESIRYLKDVVFNGNLGRLLYMDLDWSSFLEPPKGRDIIFDLGPHPVDIVNYVTGEWPKLVCTLGNSIKRGVLGLEEFSHTIMMMPDDITVSIKLSWWEYGAKNRHVNAVFEDGRIFVDALSQNIWVYNRNGKPETLSKKNNSMREMLIHFTKVIEKKEHPNNSAVIGGLTVSILEVMKHSLSKKTCEKTLGMGD